MANNTTGGSNTAVGLSAANANTTGSNNTAIGVRAFYNGNGTNNTAVGIESLYNGILANQVVDGTFSVAGLTNWVLGTGWADGTGKASKNADGTGTKNLDDAAIRALKDAAPFWPLPDEWGREAYTIVGHFVYTLYGYYLR